MKLLLRDGFPEIMDFDLAANHTNLEPLFCLALNRMAHQSRELLQRLVIELFRTFTQYERDLYHTTKENIRKLWSKGKCLGLDFGKWKLDCRICSSVH